MRMVIRMSRSVEIVVENGDHEEVLENGDHLDYVVGGW